MTLLYRVLILVFLFPIPALARQEMSVSHKNVIQQVYAEVFNSGVLEVMDALYAPDYMNHGFGKAMTLADYKASIAAMRAAMPDFQAAIEVLIAEGEWAASRVVYGGTFEKDWVFDGETLPPTGARVEWTLNILHRFNEQGQIAEDFTAFDRLALPLANPLPPYLENALTPSRRFPIIMQDPLNTGMEEAHKETFRVFIEEVLNKGNLEAIDLYMAEDHRTHEPFGDFTRGQFKQIIEGFRATVPDLHVEIEALVAEADWLAARLVYTGTFSNPLASGGMTLEPTHQPIRFIIHVFVRFNEAGVGIEDYKEYNRLSWLQQGGLLPEGNS
jgi:predicted ester cyclase